MQELYISPIRSLGALCLRACTCFNLVEPSSPIRNLVSCACARVWSNQVLVHSIGWLICSSTTQFVLELDYVSR